MPVWEIKQWVKMAKGDTVETIVEDAMQQRSSSGKKPVAPPDSPPNEQRVQQQELEAEKEAIINTPSIYPVDAELPIHPTEDFKTKHIQEAIIELRQNEPLIGKMTRKQLNTLIYPYTQRIQTYGKYGDAQRVTGPIDPGFVEWAGECFLKLRAREAILDCRANISGIPHRHHAHFNARFGSHRDQQASWRSDHRCQIRSQSR
jgi:hypothetical protein